jgi:hypothetical protein
MFFVALVTISPCRLAECGAKFGIEHGGDFHDVAFCGKQGRKPRFDLQHGFTQAGGQHAHDAFHVVTADQVAPQF